MQNDAVIGLVEAVGRADGHAGGVVTVHTSDGNGHFIRFAIIQCHHAAALDTPLDIVGIFTGGDTAVAFNAAFCVTHKFHLSHGVLLMPVRDGSRTAVLSGRSRLLF